MSKQIGIKTDKGYVETDGTALKLEDITLDKNGVLKMGDAIISQRKILKNEEIIIIYGSSVTIDVGEDLSNKTIEIECEVGSDLYGFASRAILPVKIKYKDATDAIEGNISNCILHDKDTAVNLYTVVRSDVPNSLFFNVKTEGMRVKITKITKIIE